MSILIRTFEQIITTLLIIMLAVVVALSLVELGWLLIKDVFTPPLLFLEIDELLDIFGMFLLVLIGLELLETMKVYLNEAVVRVEVVILVAMLAVGRKLVTLDLKHVTSGSLLGLAAIIVALAIAHYAFRRADSCGAEAQKTHDP